MREGGFIGYPTGWLLAVFDEPAQATGLADAVAAGANAPDLMILQGPEAAARFDGLGRGGGLAGWRRAFQQLAMDQMPDFLWYEEATKRGAVVLAVRAPDRDYRASVVRRVRAAGAHFVNYFGSWATEPISPWRGEERDVPQLMRR